MVRFDQTFGERRLETEEAAAAIQGAVVAFALFAGPNQDRLDLAGDKGTSELGNAFISFKLSARVFRCDEDRVERNELGDVGSGFHEGELHDRVLSPSRVHGLLSPALPLPFFSPTRNDV